jgi:hypothetical protein
MNQEFLRTLNCPFSGERMQDPVILIANGVSYERTAIARWLEETEGLRPDTGARLTAEQQRLVPNTVLRALIAAMR